MISRARALAFDILRLVEEGGYAGELLHARSAQLDERDAGLVSELVMGVLRRRARLDHLIQHYASRDPARLDLAVRIALRLGIYQLRELDRIPPHAAVGESVELVKRARKTSAAGLVNAVLRKVDRDPVAWPNRAVAFSLPQWLWEAWTEQFGETIASRIGQAFLEPPAAYVRVPPPRDQDAKVIGAEPTEMPGCYRLPPSQAGRQAENLGLRLQDIGSQSIVPLLDLQPGQTLLDLCAAPGNKTAQALESGVAAVACDIHPSRLQALAPLACYRVALDAAQPLPFRRKFPRILLDAPCSGTGTLSRNPEIRWRVQPDDIRRLQRRQVALLENSLGSLESGGKLVYSTCSLERKENEDVVAEVLAGAGSDYALEAQQRRIPGVDPGDGFYVAVITLRQTS